jgi:P-type Mg2+ transporter
VTRTVSAPQAAPAAPPDNDDRMDVAASAALDTDVVLQMLGTGSEGLSGDEAHTRLARVGANTVPVRRVTLASIINGQVRSPLLLLLLATAVLSAVLGERTNATIIIVILFASVGLGAGNDYRAARTAKALQADVREEATTVRQGSTIQVDVADLVPGDIVRLTVGNIVPADIRLVHLDGLSCEEGVLTGEALPVEKSATPVTAGSALAELQCCALMGTALYGIIALIVVAYLVVIDATKTLVIGGLIATETRSGPNRIRRQLSRRILRFTPHAEGGFRW